MASYRLYFMDGKDHILQAAESECEDDDDALDWAAEKLDGRPVELWSGARLVAAPPIRRGKRICRVETIEQPRATD